jgi:hypothetical protein
VRLRDHRLQNVAFGFDDSNDVHTWIWRAPVAACHAGVAGTAECRHTQTTSVAHPHTPSHGRRPRSPTPLRQRARIRLARALETSHTRHGNRRVSSHPNDNCRPPAHAKPRAQTALTDSASPTSAHPTRVRTGGRHTTVTGTAECRHTQTTTVAHPHTPSHRRGPRSPTPFAARRTGRGP